MIQRKKERKEEKEREENGSYYLSWDRFTEETQKIKKYIMQMLNKNETSNQNIIYIIHEHTTNKTKTILKFMLGFCFLFFWHLNKNYVNSL